MSLSIAGGGNATVAPCLHSVSSHDCTRMALLRQRAAMRKPGLLSTTRVHVTLELQRPTVVINRFPPQNPAHLLRERVATLSDLGCPSSSCCTTVWTIHPLQFTR